ncbi:hypothetical protein HDU98_001109 [Podochytrium sp. JEL0797]|nr:hypothetical protein HDU98_001109 [Podochytrium sp. JEL0797]
MMDTIPEYDLLHASSLLHDDQTDEKLRLYKEAYALLPENFAFLDAFQTDHDTPTLHRATAAFTHGMMLLQQDNNELAANQLRKTISLCDNMSLQELDSQVFVGVEESSQSPLFASVRDYLSQPDSISNLAQLNLDSLNESHDCTDSELAEMREINAELDSSQPHAAPHSSKSDKRFNPNHTPGNQCDSCGVPAEFEESGSTIRAHLKPCHGCSTKFYCCAACQRNAWETGHQSICRASTNLVKFDLVRIQGLKNSKYTHMNGNVYEVRVPAPLSTPGDITWIVSEVGRKKVVAKHATFVIAVVA